jgi:hypothetical protein
MEHAPIFVLHAMSGAIVWCARGSLCVAGGPSFRCTTTYLVEQVDHSAVRLLAMASPQQPARADAVFLHAAVRRKQDSGGIIAKLKAIQANPLKELHENND